MFWRGLLYLAHKEVLFVELKILFGAAKDSYKGANEQW